MHTSFKVVLFVVLAFFCCVTCSDSTGDRITLGELPQLVVSINGTDAVNGTTKYITASDDVRVLITNASEGVVANIKNVYITNVNDFVLNGQHRASLHPGEQHEVSLISLVPGTETTLIINTDLTIDGSETFKFYVKSASAAPAIDTTPRILNYGTVPAGTVKELTVNVLNVGTATLVISGVVVSDERFVTQFTNLSVSPGEYEVLTVVYEALVADPVSATLTLFSNDLNKREGHQIKLLANTRGPCITTRPSKIDFGAVRVGNTSVSQVTIESCGDEPSVITSISIADDLQFVFGVNSDQFTIQPGSGTNINVSYSPVNLADTRSDGTIVSDDSELAIVTSDGTKTIVPLTGYGVTNNCPVAVLTSTTADEVIPQTVIRLSADDSYSDSGVAVTKWSWTVDQPVGSVSQFVPNNNIKSPTFEANVVGVYTFKLSVWDVYNNKSCNVATRQIVVTSDEAVRVELLWDTPGDPDQSDTGMVWDGSVGTDVDLHFVRESAEYFDIFYDCFWKNVSPDWGTVNSHRDDPRLDRDDTDGAGPENLNLTSPEEVSYKVGVHYWNAWGFGPSWITLRVYIYGQLVDEWNSVMLREYDLWDTYYVSFRQSPSVTRIGIVPQITPNYPLPYP